MPVHLSESFATRVRHETGWWSYDGGFFNPCRRGRLRAGNDGTRARLSSAREWLLAGVAWGFRPPAVEFRAMLVGTAHEDLDHAVQHREIH